MFNQLISSACESFGSSNTMRAAILLLVSSLFLHGAFGARNGHGLMEDFYKESCPNAEMIVRNVTWKLTAADQFLQADLLRLHYHDCFVRGCDASILLDSTKTSVAERDQDLNLSLDGFNEIDEIKSEVEKECPGIVSCADILALAARDSVSFKFKRPMWPVLTGRRDGKISLASEVPGNLPVPSSDFKTLEQLFGKKGLNVNDLVALSGAHTIGHAHCDAFINRLFNFKGKGGVDPTLDATYAALLKKKCPKHFKNDTLVVMDPQSSFVFDSHYFENLYQNKGLFQSDAALLTNAKSAMIAKLLQEPKEFFSHFAKSMKKMGSVEVLTGFEGEIRKQCHFVNH